MVKLELKNEALGRELKSCKAELSQYSDFFSEEEKRDVSSLMKIESKNLSKSMKMLVS